MLLRRLLARPRSIYQAYPGQFWVLIVGTFIDRVGGALIFPFFTLYITRQFDVSMTRVGLVFGLFAASSVVGSTLGGAATDRMGRKGMLIFGLVGSAVATLLMGLADTFGLFLLSTLLVGLLSNSGGPAQQAMVADLLPQEKRTSGFGILRVVVNLAITIGPAIGGLLAARSYFLLFVSDVVASLTAALFVLLTIRETKPESEPDEKSETMAETFKGYRVVLADAVFVLFMLGAILRAFVAMQMTTTLPVYLRDIHGVSEQGYGYIMSLNAALVVLLQFPITRWFRGHRPLRVMAWGMVVYALGFGMYGFVSSYIPFLVAIAVVTVGEMMTAPVAQSLVSRMAPERMRGRYMAVYGFSWVVPAAAGPTLAGVLMDHVDPRWVWYTTGLIGFISAGVFLRLRHRAGGPLEGVDGSTGVEAVRRQEARERV
jgi:MFS family permease